MKFYLPLALLVVASGQTTVTSRAGFAIPDGTHDGTASIVANIVQTPSETTGTLTYAAEDHSDHAKALYPHVLVTLRRFESVTATGNQVEVKGFGRFHDESVRVTALLVDNAGTGKPDRFEIACQKEGHIVYQRKGDIQTGDIAIRREP